MNPALNVFGRGLYHLANYTPPQLFLSRGEELFFFMESKFSILTVSVFFLDNWIMEVLDIEELKKAYKDIIKNATDFLVLVCPYFLIEEEQNFANDVLTLLEENTSVKKILFIYRKKTKYRKIGNRRKRKAFNDGISDKYLDEIKEKLQKNNRDAFLLNFKNLHAKSAINENQTLICSLNLTDCSARNSNFEIGMTAYNSENLSDEERKCYKEICLTVASFYNDIAKKQLEDYKKKTRNANKEEETKEYDVKKSLEILNNIDYKKLFFDEEAKLKRISTRIEDKPEDKPDRTYSKDLIIVKYPYKTS